MADLMDTIQNPGRLNALRQTALLDTSSEQSFDRLTKLAAKLLHVPVALVSLVDKDRQFFKSYVGLPEPWATTRETPLSHSFCQHTVHTGHPFIVMDAREHPLVRDNLAITDLDVIAYIGIPLATSSGEILGSFCAIDRVPRNWTAEELDLLRELTGSVITEIELRSATLEHQRQEQRFRSLVHHAPAIIAVIDPEGVVEYMTPWVERVLGRPPAAVIGANVFDVVHGDDVARLRATLSFALTRPGLQSAPVEVRVRDRGSNRWHVLETWIINQLDDPGVHGLVLNARDVTDQSEAFAALQATNVELHRLSTIQSHVVSIVSHEFRTALTGIQGFSELIRDEDFTVSEMKEYASDIHEDAKRINRMITELLDLDRMESGRMTLNVEAVDLNQLMATVAERVRPTALNHHLTLRPDASLPPLAGDRDKLTQVFTNLINNAVKYAPSGGAVTIGTLHEGDTAHLWVQDQGVGIPPEALETVFERYSRLESSGSRYIQGTGLGLPIVRQVVQLHGGRVWAESSAGHGATFHVTLPLVPLAVPRG